MTERIMLENDRIKVSHVSMDVDETKTDSTRGDRVIIFLTDSDHERHVDGQTTVHSRERLEAIWRDSSTHTVKNLDIPQELIIVELK